MRLPTIQSERLTDGSYVYSVIWERRDITGNQTLVIHAADRMSARRIRQSLDDGAVDWFARSAVRTGAVQWS